jgi:mannosyltransferase OCH1-like enzyme
MIPVIIHQIWFQFGTGPSSPPADYDELRRSWRQHHPDWVVMQWDREKSRQFLQQHYPQFVELFDSYKREIFRVDAIRYFLLHHYGGFYVDTDCQALDSIEALRSHKVVLAVDRYTKRINNNHFMGAEPQTAFFQDCINRLRFSTAFQLNRDSYLSTMSVAGPFFLTALRNGYRRKAELYVMPLEVENRYLVHQERHTWKVAKSLGGDISRLGFAAGAVLATGFLVKRNAVVSG